MSATGDGSLGRVAVVDRPGWIRANVDGFRVVLEPLVDQLPSARPELVQGGGRDRPRWDRGSPASRPG